MPPKAKINAQRRDLLIANLHKNASYFSCFSSPEKDIQRMQDLLVISEYFSRPNHRGGIMMPKSSPERRQLSNGKWIAWADVKAEKVVDALESKVDQYVEEGKKSEVWEKLFEGCEDLRKKAKWQRNEPSKHEIPQTKWSVSKATKPKSNAELIDVLAEAAGMDDKRKRFVTSCIIRSDSGVVWALLKDGIWDTGDEGRLGRAHMLEDCPNHYVRDFIMEYVQEYYSEDQDRITAAVFDEMSEWDLKAYKEIFSQTKKIQAELERIKPVSQDAATNIVDQELQLDMIDDTIDITPHADGYFGLRDFDCMMPVMGSVVKPGVPAPDEQNQLKGVGGRIDRDCDQVRAMIVRLIKYGDEGWTLDTFRKALGRIYERKKLLGFLKLRGPKAGMKQMVFFLAWEFFQTRDLLGVPLPSAATQAEASKKRKRGPLEERDTNEGPLNAVNTGITRSGKVPVNPVIKKKKTRAVS